MPKESSEDLKRMSAYSEESQKESLRNLYGGTIHVELRRVNDSCGV